MDNAAIAKSLDILDSTIRNLPFDIGDKVAKSLREDNVPELSKIKDSMVDFLRSNTLDAFQMSALANTLDSINESSTRADKRHMAEQDANAINARNEERLAEQLVSASRESNKTNKYILEELQDQSSDLHKILAAQLVTGNNGSRVGGLGAVGSVLGLGKAGGMLKAAKGIGKKIGVLGLGFAFIDDALQSIADPRLRDKSIFARAVSGMITGGTKGTTTGNALKFGGVGAILGSIVFPGVGTLIGGALGSLVGAILSKANTIDLAQWVDDGMKKLSVVFSAETWFGEEGILSRVYKIPKMIDNLMSDLWNNREEYLKEISDRISTTWDEVKDISKNLISEPFKNLLTKAQKWYDSTSLAINEKWTTTKEDIISFVSKPFSKEFWADLFADIGDIWTDISSSVTSTITRLKNQILDFLIPEKITILGKEINLREKSSSSQNQLAPDLSMNQVIPMSKPDQSHLNAVEKYLAETRTSSQRQQSANVNVNQAVNSGNQTSVSVQNIRTNTDDGTANRYMNSVYGW